MCSSDLGHLAPNSNMMHSSPLFSLSLILFVLCSCKPAAAAAAATLAVSQDRRRYVPDPIECPVPLNADIPRWLPRYPSLLDMCASSNLYRANLACRCQGKQRKDLVCGFSPQREVRALLKWCLDLCACGDDTNIKTDEFTVILKLEPPKQLPPPRRPPVPQRRPLPHAPPPPPPPPRPRPPAPIGAGSHPTTILVRPVNVS